MSLPKHKHDVSLHLPRSSKFYSFQSMYLVCSSLKLCLTILFCCLFFAILKLWIFSLFHCSLLLYNNKINFGVSIFYLGISLFPFSSYRFYRIYLYKQSCNLWIKTLLYFSIIFIFLDCLTTLPKMNLGRSGKNRYFLPFFLKLDLDFHHQVQLHFMLFFRCYFSWLRFYFGFVVE